MRERVEELLKAGLSRSEVARQLDLSPSTVSRHALRLGLGGRSLRTRYDWATISTFYEEGNSLAECRRRFGFSNGAWDAAVSRGDVTPRLVPARRPTSARREEVRALFEAGVIAAEIARRLGISPATVSHHLRVLGVPARRRFAIRHDWSAIRSAYEEQGLSARECRRRFGCSVAAWHDAIRRGDLAVRPHAMPISTLLAAPRSRTHIKARLVAAGLKEPRCELCGIDSWRGSLLSLALHHVNGVGDDNSLENLQLLCPNCHSQTDTFAGRNAGARASAGLGGSGSA